MKKNTTKIGGSTSVVFFAQGKMVKIIERIVIKVK